MDVGFTVLHDIEVCCSGCENLDTFSMNTDPGVYLPALADRSSMPCASFLAGPSRVSSNTRT